MKLAYYEKYYTQRRESIKRGIDFQFSFEDWIQWWGNDIVNRGRCKGQLVMARYKDQGPYHPDNVRKATCSENATEAHKGKIRPHTEEHNNKISVSKRKSINTPHGIFDSRKSCADYYNVYPNAVGYWMKTKPTEYHYI
jgi:hypothetical protein